MAHCFISAPKTVETQGVRMHRSIVIVLSVVLLVAFVFAWLVALPDLLPAPGWAPYI